MHITITMGPDYHSLENWVMNESAAFNRIFMPINGRAAYRSVGCTIELKPGHLYVLPSHLFYRIMSQKFEVVFVDVILYPMITDNLIDVSLENNPVLAHTLEILRQLLYDGNMTYALAEHIVRFLVEYLVQQRFVTPADDQFFADAILLINQRKGINVTVQELADACNINRVSFSQKFNAAFGMTPQQFIIRTRMQLAMQYLSSNYTIADTAFYVGYEDVKSFSRAFKKYCSISPRAYQRTCRSSREKRIPPFLPPPPGTDI